MSGNIDELLLDDCEHDIQPVDEHWGRCTKCGEGDFPLTVEAAYGPVKCTTCCDTGLVPAVIEARPHAMADARCPKCGGGE